MIPTVDIRHILQVSCEEISLKPLESWSAAKGSTSRMPANRISGGVQKNCKNLLDYKLQNFCFQTPMDTALSQYQPLQSLQTLYK